MCIAVGGLLRILNTILCTPLIKRRQKQQTTTHLIEEHTSTTMDGTKVTPAQFVGEQEARCASVAVGTARLSGREARSCA